MQISNYVKMDYGQLAKEIEKQTKKIKTAQETIKLLKKLQIAETANSERKKTDNTQDTTKEIANGISYEIYR